MSDRLTLLANQLKHYEVSNSTQIVNALDLFFNKNSLYGLLDFYTYSFPIGVSLAIAAYSIKLGKDIDNELYKVRTRSNLSCVRLQEVKARITDYDTFITEYLEYPYLEFNPYNPNTLLDWHPEPKYIPLQDALKNGDLPSLGYHLVGLNTGYNIKHWPNKYRELSILLQAAYGKVVLGANAYFDLI